MGEDGGTNAVPALNPVIASWPHVFQHTDFQFQFLLGLGSAYEQAADVGELFAAASQITDGDYDSWYDTFYALGEQVQRIAESSASLSDPISAREAWLRASGYYGQAYFFTYGTKQPDRIVATWERHRACFDQFATLLQPAAELVTIPYENTTLPGYVLRVDATGVPRPWLDAYLAAQFGEGRSCPWDEDTLSEKIVSPPLTHRGAK